MEPLILIFSGNAIEYYFRGIQIERLLVVDGHPQEHMVQVVKRLRSYPPLRDYRAARAVWDSRQECSSYAAV